MLRIEGLRVSIYKHFRFYDVVRGVDLSLERGEWLGLVGESGSGKTMTALSILGLIDPWPGIVTGKIKFGDVDLLSGIEAGCRVTRLANGETTEVSIDNRWKQSLDQRWDGIRGKAIGMIFQEPVSSLDPCFTVGEQIGEILLKWKLAGDEAEARQLAIQWLQKVAIRDSRQVIDFYPHELSGGMAQRVMIALALCAEPQILIADEPTTALDVTIQKQIMLLLDKLRREMNLSIIFISHNMPLVTAFADRIAVMYKGRIIENIGGSALNKASVDLSHLHPFTAALLDPLNPLNEGQTSIALPDSIEFDGCEYASSCSLRQTQCFAAPPALLRLTDDHQVACFVRQQKRLTEVTADE